MKKITRPFGLFLSIFSLLVISCDNEPLEGDFGQGNTGGGTDATCAAASANVVPASLNFLSATPEDPNYSTYCIAYVAALQAQIDACGDESGVLQATISTIGACGSEEECDSATQEANSAGSAYNNDSTNIDLCNAYISALENQIVVCGDPTGDIQAMIDGLSCSGNPPSGDDYWPRAIGNSWTFNTFSNGVETFEIIGMETIDGLEYYAFDELFFVPSWIRKSGPNYFVRNEFSGSVPGYQFVSTPFIVNMIKDDTPVGGTWETSVSYTISYIPEPGSPDVPDADVNALYAFEMMERGISRTVEGVTYTDVIHLELVVTALGTTNVSQYYYANNIGMIDYITDSGSNALMEYTLN